jgi:hypothetical protein
VPVYSIFRGKIGAVDRYLSEQNRLTLIESPQDVPVKIKLERRKGMGTFESTNRPALQNIADFIVAIVEARNPKLVSSPAATLRQQGNL